MVIVHVIVGLNVGGAELMLRRLVEIQRTLDSSVEHHVLALTNLGVVGADLQRAGVPVMAFGLRNPLQVPSVFFRMVQTFRKLRPNVVQTWMYHADLLGGLAARLSGCQNIIWGIRTTDIAKGGSRATALVRWLCARLSRRVPHTIVCAAQAAQRLHVGLGYCAERMVVIPNGFDMTHLQASTAEVAALRHSLGLGAGVLVVGTLGRFNAVKDQHNFVRAAGLLASNNASTRFLMVGRGCDVSNLDLASWILATGFAERFVLLGERSDAPVCLAAMDVFVLTSRTEGFPNVLAEAMAMGRPCITTDVGDAAYVLGGCGVVVPAEDSAALARGIGEMLDITASERIAMGQAAQARVINEFSMKKCADLFGDVYVNVLTNQRK